MEKVRPNTVKQKLQSGRPVFDVRISIPDPDLVEIAGRAGVDAIWIDGEHSNFDWDRALSCVLAAELHGMMPILRPPELAGHREYMIRRALDIGFQGIVVTGVSNREGMRRMLDVIMFPPRGKRGGGEGRVFFRAGELDPTVLQAMNDEIFVLVLIETAEGVEKIDEICAMDGVHAAGLGHRDYALDAGLPDFSLEQPAMEDAIRRVSEAALRHGKASTGSAATIESFAQSRRAGALYFSLGRETKTWQKTCERVSELRANGLSTRGR